MHMKIRSFIPVEIASFGSTWRCAHSKTTVLECAVILTTCNALDEVARRNWVISTTQAEIDTRVLGGAGGDFHRMNSMSNGLINDCLTSSTTYTQWQTELLDFLQSHCYPRCRLAGFSVHVDQDVLRTQALLVYQFLSHQIIDISSLDSVQWGLPDLENAVRSRTFDNGNHVLWRTMRRPFPSSVGTRIG
jgi:oligoribonuclease (3'-5' exoribonuclease)